MLDLPQDLIGTNPKYPAIVNHDWLSVNPATYDNFPSDNNPVRVVPKLADLWGHEAQQEPGINLIPNMTVQQLGVNDVKSSEVSASVIREAKKAMMAGMSGRDLADHLRARFSAQDIVLAKDGLSKLSEEQGLLGNVYIDASAFASWKEAERFLDQHRTRLAQDIVLNDGKISASVVGELAKRFRKNVLASVTYDAKTLEKYKAHLVASGRIPKDFVVDSKAALRHAFMYAPEKETVVKAKAEKTVDKATMFKNFSEKMEKDATISRLANDDITFRKIQPILKCAREQMVKGKFGADLKEILRKKYATEDLNESARYLSLVISDVNFTPANIDQLVEANAISEYVGNSLKKLAKEYPIKKTSYAEEAEVPRSIGVQGYFYNLSGNKVSDDLDQYREACVTALRKGIELDKIRQKLASVKLSKDQIDRVMLDAMNMFNSTAAGVKANPQEKKAKVKVVADLPERQTLPDPETITAQTEDIISFFEGSGNDIDIDIAPQVTSSLDVGDLFNRSGMDSAL
jgi:hypothetical protein